MKHVSKSNSLKFGSDVQLVSWGNPNEFWKYIDQNKNKTLFGVIFCGESHKENFSWDNTFENVNGSDIRIALPC